MKISFNILLAFLWCLAASSYTECYGGGRRDLLFRHLLKKKDSRKQDNLPTESLKSKVDLPVFVGPQEGRREADKIIKLPGQPDVKFSQYSGYVTVDPKAGRELFYYFVEAEKPKDKPLVLWLDGEEEVCSSMGGGAMTELGPFRVNRDGETLSSNKYAWNNVANVLFLESPAGVGFSYSGRRSSDYKTGDKQTAADSYTFLVNWLERFQEYKKREFFLAGENYAGHYIPQLAELILNKNKNTPNTVIRLEGIALGNALLDDTDSNVGTHDYWWTHALISDEIYSRINAYCHSSSPNVTSCSHYLDIAEKEMGNIDVYNIYAPISCLSYSSATAPSGMQSSFDPYCFGEHVDKYLNTYKVQMALHADIDGIPAQWKMCNKYIYKNWIDTPTTVIPVIKKLMHNSLIRVLIYSGDTSGIVPVTATKYSLPKLGAKVETPWYPWYSKSVVGGYAVVYDLNLTFATVRGAGHYVPRNQPGLALELFASFLQGKSPPHGN